MSRPQHEYLVEDLGRGVVALEQQRLDTAGLGGWELVSVDGGKAYFRRPLPRPEGPGGGRGAGAAVAAFAPLVPVFFVLGLFGLIGLIRALGWVWGPAP